MDPRSNNYFEIADFGRNIQNQWETECSWKTIEDTDPEKWNGIPDEAGIYKLTFTGETLRLPDEYVLCSRKIPNTEDEKELCEGILPAGTILTIGKSRHLRRRIRQHFSKNSHVNRIGTHLNKLFNYSEEFTGKGDFEVLFKTLSEHCLQLSFCLVEQWWQRDLLEAYGRCISFSLFDLGFEH